MKRPERVIDLAETVKGINVIIGAETTGLSKALADVNRKSNSLQKELKQVDKLLKFDPGNAELLAQKQEILGDAAENTREKLDRLRKVQDQVEKQFASGDISDGQYRAFQREVAQAEQELKRLEDQGEKTLTVLSKDQATGNLKRIGVAAGAAAAALTTAMVAAGVAVLNNADEIQKMADVTGLSAERIQELTYAGNNLGVEIDAITGGQAKLTKAMAAAKKGTGAQAEAFDKLKISVLDSNGNLRDAKEVMAEAIDALGGIKNETERDALAMQLFGRSAMDLNPLIKAGGDELNRLTEEARKNGAVMSDEAVAGLDSFGDTLDNLKNGILGSFGEAFAKIAPDVQKFLENMQELPQWIEDNSNKLIIIGGVIGTITALIIAFNIQQALAASGLTIWSAVAGVATGVTTALGVAFRFLTGPIGIVITIIGLLVTAGILLYKNWDTVKAKAKEMGQGVKDAFGAMVDWAKSKWQSFGDAFMAVWNGIKAGVKGIVNSLIGMINSLIGGLNRIQVDIPEWVPKFGGRHFGINIPKVPALQTGTNYVPRDMLAILHRGEAVVPKKYNTQSGGVQRIEHSGTIRHEGINDNGELVAVVKQEFTRGLAEGSRRIPNRVSLIPI
jgi:phage-related minor tail protein